ncbi:MAG: DNA-binding protein [Bacteroidia bacterium]|nr:DNA-binding protein [Bacteroidia bacterium]
MSKKILKIESVSELLASQWLTEKEVAALTRLSLSTLRSHRFAGKGLPYAKLGRMVRYSASEVERYMESRQIYPSN